jgi:hypothetical protein
MKNMSKIKFKNSFYLFVKLTFISATVSGCVGVVSESANIAKDRAVASSNMEGAKKGDRVAQYKVGKSYCCSLDDDKELFYSTEASVAWLCRSARQEYGPAALKLGEIYSGDTISGVRILRRLASKIAGTNTANAVAYAWFRKAQDYGESEAQEKSDDLWKSLDKKTRAEARSYINGEERLPCLLKEVIKI